MDLSFNPTLWPGKSVHKRLRKCAKTSKIEVFQKKLVTFGFKNIWPWRSNRGRFWHMASPTWGPNDRFEPLNASIGFRMIISQHCAKVGRLEKNWIFFRKFFQFFADFSRVDRALGPKFLPQIPEVLGFQFDVKCWGGGAATAQDILGQSWGVFWIFVIFLKKFAI